jgi:AcrR family transcriptional regulator
MNTDVNRRAFPVRTAKATATRVAIVEAALPLFVQLGYDGVSVQAVADAAGVSRATVFNSIGGKPALLKACYDIATVGDDDPVPLPQRAGLLAVRAEPDQRRMIELYAAVITDIGSRLAGIYEIFRAASTAQPEIRQLWEQIQHERLGGARGFVHLLREKGQLRPGLDKQEAADIVWAHIDASLYQRLVGDRGWSQRRFNKWLARTLIDHLLPTDLP